MTSTERLPLRRPERGRWVGGVAAGLAAHLGVPVALLRALLLVLAAMGAGVVAYVFLWVTVPPGDPVRAAAEQRAPELSRLARRPTLDPARLPVTDIALGLVALAGLAISWSQLGRTVRARWVAGGRTPVSVLRLVGGVVLAVVGVLLLVSQGASMSATINAAVAAVAVLLGVALVLAPWW